MSGLLWPVEGSPDALELIAAGCQEAGSQISDLLVAIQGLRTGVWDSPAGEAFAASLGEVSAILQRVAMRYGDAAGAIDTYAAALRLAQARAQAALESHRDAEEQVLSLEDELWQLSCAGEGAGTTAYESALGRQRQAVGQSLAAEGDHTRAAQDADEANEVCAATLRRIADDVIADPVPYRVLHTLSQVGATMASLALIPHPATRAVGAVGGLVATGADVSLRLFYDEGSWGDLLLAAFFTGLGTSGKVLKAGSGLGVEKGADKTFTLTRTYTTGERVRAASAQRWRGYLDSFDPRTARSGAAATVSATTPATATVAGGGGLGARLGQLRQRAADAVRNQVDKHFLDGLRKAKINDTTTMFAAGITLQGTSKVAPRLVPDPAPPPPQGSPRPAREAVSTAAGPTP